MDEANWSSLKATELKVALKERGLAVNGRKADLIKRLEEYDLQVVVAQLQLEVAVVVAQPPVDNADVDDLQPSSMNGGTEDVDEYNIVNDNGMYLFIYVLLSELCVVQSTGIYSI